MPANNSGVVKEIGVIAATEGSEIRFSVDEFKGHRYGSIRKHLKRESYSGPTRSGITMSPEIVSGVLEALRKLPKEPPAEERELGRYAKRPGLAVVARITIYQDSVGIDLREWQQDVSYTGWTKKGIRLAYADLEKITLYLSEMKEALSGRENL